MVVGTIPQIEAVELEDEYVVDPIQPTASMDVETIEILLEDRIATGG